MSVQQRTSAGSRIAEIAIPFWADERLRERLARTGAALNRAIRAQVRLWGVGRDEIAVFGPQRGKHEGVAAYVYRLVEDRKPRFGKARGPERHLLRHEVWSRDAERRDA